MSCMKCDKTPKEINKNKKPAFEDYAEGHDHHPQLELSPKEYIHRFTKKLKHDSKRFKYFVRGRIAEEQEKMRRNEQELDELKKHYNNMLMEETEIKRKFWCRYCEGEATYLRQPRLNFYCSTDCEQYHKNLLGVLMGGAKSNLDLPAGHTSLFP